AHDFLAGWLDASAPRALATHVLVPGDEGPARTAERGAAIARDGTGEAGPRPRARRRPARGGSVPRGSGRGALVFRE
uniref:hypothetical protein n=1 Tax=Cellulomonas sp. GbtcB1 TaxID=2824746 RepID=UPI001C308444